MSELVDFQDLDLLDGGDLRAVIAQASESSVVAALFAASPGQRRRILDKLAPETARRLDDLVRDHAADSDANSDEARREVVETLRRLGRNGVIAFADPDDIVDE